MLNQKTKDTLLSLLKIADSSKRYKALSAIEEAMEISHEFNNACEKNNWDCDSLKNIEQMIDWVKIQYISDELDEKQKRVTDELRAYHKNSSVELDDVISDYFQMMRDKSKPVFDGNSYSLGFPEYEFTLHHYFLDESRAKRYLDLLKLTGQGIGSNQYASIKAHYPHLL